MNRRLFILCMIAFLAAQSCQNNPYPQGEWLYKQRCQQCHMDDGSGLGLQIPSLVHAPSLLSDRKTAVCLIYQGLDAPDTRTKQLAMPSNKDLTPADLANLINYIHYKWHPKVSAIKENDIEGWLTECTK